MSQEFDANGNPVLQQEKSYVRSTSTVLSSTPKPKRFLIESDSSDSHSSKLDSQSGNPLSSTCYDADTTLNESHCSLVRNVPAF